MALCLVIPVVGVWAGNLAAIVLGVIPIFVLGIAWSVRSDSWLALDDQALQLRMGFLFRDRIDLDEIVSVGPGEHRYLGGLGARRLKDGSLGLILDTDNVLRIELRSPRSFRVFPGLRFSTNLITTNPAEAERFTADLNRRRESLTPSGPARPTGAVE